VLFLLGILTSYKIRSLEEVKTAEVGQSFTMILFYLLTTALSMPIQIIIMTTFICDHSKLSLGLDAGLQIINILNFALYIWTNLILEFTLNLKLYSSTAPNCRTDFRLLFVRFFLKVTVAACYSIMIRFEDVDDIGNIVCIILNITASIYYLACLILVPNYNTYVTIFDDYTSWITLLLTLLLSVITMTIRLNES
jgi:hypothetical protein